MRCLETRTDSLLDVVAINDSGGVKQASHLLKYDSTLGKFDAEVKVVDDGHISVNGKVIRVVSSRDPTKLPWGEMDIDLVIEGTGVFIDTPGASKHIQVGAPKVLRVACFRMPTPHPVFECGSAEHVHGVCSFQHCDGCVEGW